MVYESICTQTDISSLKTIDAETQIDDDLPPIPPMPVLTKEVRENKVSSGVDIIKFNNH